MNDISKEYPTADIVSAIHLLRSIQKHFAQLSTMSDFKANVVVGVSLLTLANFMTKINMLLKMPSLMILSVFLVFSLIFALISLMPKLTKGRERSANEPIDYLFFPNFIHMSWDDYELEIRKILSNEEEMVKSLTVEIYQMGQYISGKFTYINRSYQLMFVGIVISVTVFTGHFIYDEFVGLLT